MNGWVIFNLCICALELGRYLKTDGIVPFLAFHFFAVFAGLCYGKGKQC